MPCAAHRAEDAECSKLKYALLQMKGLNTNVHLMLDIPPRERVRPSRSCEPDISGTL